MCEGHPLYRYSISIGYATLSIKAILIAWHATALCLLAKTFIIDREFVYVGTLDMDPRSFNLNSEMGRLVAFPPLAEQVAALVEQDMGLENAWKVTLDRQGRLVWTSS